METRIRPLYGKFGLARGVPIHAVSGLFGEVLWKAAAHKAIVADLTINAAIPTMFIIVSLTTHRICAAGAAVIRSMEEKAVTLVAHTSDLATGA